MTTYKEEYFEYDQTTKMVKKEEQTSPKLEETSSNTTYYTNFTPNASYMPLPWRQFPIQVPMWPLSLQMQQFRQLYYNNQYQNSQMMMTKDPRDAQPEQASSTCSSASPVKTESTVEIKVNLRKPRKKSNRVSACKNYIGLLCAGFSRVLLTAKKDSNFYNHLQAQLLERQEKFDMLEDRGDEDLIDCFRKHVYTIMCGKKVKKQDRERDFKVRNTQELDCLLVIKEEDTPLICLKKEVLREMVNYFFNSEYYGQWLSYGMMSETNRVFFIQNKSEIQNKFLNPSSYKPRFNHVSSH